MPKLTATQRNDVYLIEASRTGIHKSILAALYIVHNNPVLADGEFGLGLSLTSNVEVTYLDTFVEQVQYGANTVQSIINQLLIDGATGNDIWDSSRGHYSDRVLGEIATGYSPPTTDHISAKLKSSRVTELKAAYLTDSEIQFDGSRTAQNLTFLDRSLIELAQGIPIYSNRSETHREAELETVRLWRGLNTRSEALQSLFDDEIVRNHGNDEIDIQLEEFFKNISLLYQGFPNQREALIRLTQIWQHLDTRDLAIASLENRTNPDTNLQIIDRALLVFAKNVPLFFQSKLDQRLAILEGLRLWRGIASRSIVLSQLGIHPQVFEKDSLDPADQLNMLKTLDQSLIDFTRRIADTYQGSPQQREALIRMFQIWKRFRTREETIKALLIELENSPQPTPDLLPVGIEIRLSRNFNLRELTRSTIADRLGLDNTPSPAEIENLRKLCLQILQPARDALGPLTVTSGFHSEVVNRRVGGLSTSHHRLGYAADIIPVSVSTLRFADWLRDNVSFDQVILEGNTPQDPKWIHVSAHPNNRRQFFHSPTPS